MFQRPLHCTSALRFHLRFTTHLLPRLIHHSLATSSRVRSRLKAVSHQRDRKCASNLQILLCACILLLFYLFSESNFRGWEGPGPGEAPPSHHLSSGMSRSLFKHLALTSGQKCAFLFLLWGQVEVFVQVNKTNTIIDTENWTNGKYSLVWMWQVMKEMCWYSGYLGCWGICSHNKQNKNEYRLLKNR